MGVKANLSWVTETLATGGDFSFDIIKASKQFADIVSQDISLIIDCREEENDAEVWEDEAPDYLHLPTTDTIDHHIPHELFDRAVEAALPVLNDGKKVFVHCHMGVNRGPSVAFAILLAQGMDPIEAFDLIREKRPEAGLWYAEDALQAHLDRIGDPSGAEEVRLKRHIDKVMTPEEIEKVNHVMREGHKTDEREYRAWKNASKRVKNLMGLVGGRW